MKGIEKMQFSCPENKFGKYLFKLTISVNGPAILRSK